MPRSRNASDDLLDRVLQLVVEAFHGLRFPITSSRELLGDSSNGFLKDAKTTHRKASKRCAERILHADTTSMDETRSSHRYNIAGHFPEGNNSSPMPGDSHGRERMSISIGSTEKRILWKFQSFVGITALSKTCKGYQQKQ